MKQHDPGGALFTSVGLLAVAFYFSEGGPTWLVFGGAAAIVVGLRKIWSDVQREEREGVAPASLVAKRVRFAGADFMILDDSSPSLVSARTGGRATVTASSSGKIGTLFVGFDADGNLVEAATEATPWDSAQLLVS
ncbi:hypothetical protein [Mycolicibacterium nivoides]|uniref:Uncharacterized protein n=1 Tax=Mycolicibacterium nivoides TaxID=2487344 RepID=A0ABW9LLQ3_9MYCO